MSGTALGVVERLLAERIGLDPQSVGLGLIARGVHARMTCLGLGSKAEYERALLAPGDELQALIEEVVVPESWFFRDERPFDVLADFARSGWLADVGRPPLAALSLPCAGGEEPYSIALTLLEAGLPAGRFRVDAVDVSARSLARAIAGVYGANSFRGSGRDLRSKYFREQNGAFTLDPAVRPAVRFHIGNLLDPASFADRPPFDVIFCRNLLIYLDDDAQARAFATLDRILVEGGLLCLGHADRAGDSGAVPFVPVGDKGSFCYRKGRGARPPVCLPLPPGEGRAEGRRRPIDVSKRATSKPSGDAAPLTAGPSPRGRGEAEKTNASGRAAPLTPGPSPRGRWEAERLSAPAESPGSILDRASSLADLGRYDEATRLVERVVSEGGGSARAFFLLGLIRQSAGDRDRAEAHFLKAVYLDAQHDEALLALALLARRRGDVAAEAVYRRRAARVLARKGAP